MSLSIRTIPTIMGNCYIIEDQNTGRNVEVMELQINAIISTDRDMGSLPHADWSKDGNSINIVHHGKPERRNITFTVEDFYSALEQS
ncbi:hypothetical protein ABGV42_00990 [Paenibacillus pabuli]|uniref:hypothetical protein n=1 Tax=Paenibacillus pabuli TaxID=1472 RepID=UPI0032427961